MLKNKDWNENTNSAYQFMGFDDFGNKEYLVNINENNHSNKTATNLDDALLDDWDFDDNQQESKTKTRYDWEDTPASEPDIYKLTKNDFFGMDWKETQYQIYRLLVNISSSLASNKEVSKENDK